MTFFFFRDHYILRTKSELRGMISGDDLFLQITAFLGRQLHYQGMTSLEIILNLGQKLLLNIKVGQK